MFQKTNEEKENQNCDKNKVYISRNKNKRNFNCDDFFVRFNFKKHDDLNEEKHKAKSKQIIEEASFQQIRNVLSKIKKQHKLIREEKTLR